MQLHLAQSQIARDLHRFRVINCGRRGGKTTLAIEEIKGKALAGTEGIVYIAPTYQQARDIAWELLKKELAPITININDSRLEIRVKNLKGTESKIALRGWESIETLRGQAFGFMVIDEVAMMRNFWSNWQEILRPTLTDKRGEVMFISTPKGFNHFYDLYNLESKDIDFKSFHFTSYDNPFIPKEELDKAREQLTEDRFAQEYLADFRKTEGLVYKVFSREKHIYKTNDFNPLAYFAGVDFGFNNPAAIIPIKKDKDNHYWIPNEWYKTNKTDEEIAEYCASQQFNYVYPDPEAPAAIEAMRRKGVNIREVTKGKDSIKNGITIVTELLKQERLHIHESCINLIWELETYSYPDKKDQRNSDELPIKENDHALDAIRYGLMMQESIRTEYAQSYTPQVHHYGRLMPPQIK